tara:strand:- start:2909 stop:3592 length:684 start_codon:yes stop_codon:yes gene_type:complete
MNISADDKMKINNLISMALMFIKIVMACFPLLVVPQKCESFSCNNQEKIIYWNAFFIPNILSFVSFLNLYYIQYKRELFLIDKFDEDDEIAEDELNNEIQKPEYSDIYQKILFYNKRIKISNEICFLTFMANTIGSSILILIYTYLDTTTFTVILTNSLLIQSKLSQIRKISQCDDLAMSSVSVKQRVYNIIDRDVSGKTRIISESNDNICLTDTQQDIATTLMQLD